MVVGEENWDNMGLFFGANHGKSSQLLLIHEVLDFS